MNDKLLRHRLAAAKAAVPPASDEERKGRYLKRARAGDPGRGGWGKPGGKPPKAPAPAQQTFRSEEDEAAAIAAAMNQVERAERELREIAPTMGELYAYPQTTEWALDDMFFDVAAWLAESAAVKFTELEGDAVIRGNGVTKPTGMLNTAPTTQDDAFPRVRNAAAYQYIATGVSGNFAATNPGDHLIDLVYKVTGAETCITTACTTSDARSRPVFIGGYRSRPTPGHRFLTVNNGQPAGPGRFLPRRHGPRRLTSSMRPATALPIAPRKSE
jgi:hypothetical protein